VKHACHYVDALIPCRGAACLTFHVCRSHFSWWARHNPLAAVRLGARIACVRRNHWTTMAFAGGEITDDFRQVQLVLRGRGTPPNGSPWVPMRAPDLMAIADWLEFQGEDASVIRSRFTVLTAATQTNLFTEVRP
jgi:hypothetical protein